MGWFPVWGREDPLKEIDPSLRQFLDKESPKQYKAEQEVQQQNSSGGWAVPTFRSIFGFGTEEKKPVAAQPSSDFQSQDNPPRPSEPSLPAESLYQDGRYAHIWKTYRPKVEIEQAAKSDQEKLEDIVGAFKERNAELGRAAMENCAGEQMAVHKCFSTGSWSSRMTMCRAENRELEKCIGLQTRFLRALGYLTLYDRSPEESEKIQMHADKLYHKLLEQEKQLDEAKNKGVPTPAFAPLVKVRGEKPQTGSTSEVARTEENVKDEEYQTQRAPIKFESMPRNLQEKYEEEHLKGLEGPARVLAKQELEQHLAWQAELVNRFGIRYMEEYKERQERRAKGEERFGDRVKRWFDMRDYSDIDKQAEQNHDQ